MSKLVLTAKIQVMPSKEEGIALRKTLLQYRDACNYVAQYCYQTHCLQQAKIHKVVYRTLRSDYGLMSQFACSVVKTVIARYKTILRTQHEWIMPTFKAPQCDFCWNKDYSLHQDKFSISTNFGRIKVSFTTKGMEKYFDKTKYLFGTAKLVLTKGKFYLHIPVTTSVPDFDANKVCNVVGVDRGINFIATTYDSKGKTTFYSGKDAKQKRAHYKELRKQLQQKQTSSARRRLKAIGQRENRWMNDVNHCIAKALVTSNPQQTLFVLEDLSNVRTATTKVRKKDRYISVSWSYFDLEQKLKYKAMQNNCLVINVDPHHTSQKCPKCGHTERANRDSRNHLFTCKTCSYRSNDDRIGAMNLQQLGINWLATKSEGSIPPPAGVQSITPRCNNTQSMAGEKGRRSKNRTTGSLQAHDFSRG